MKLARKKKINVIKAITIFAKVIRVLKEYPIRKLKAAAQLIEILSEIADDQRELKFKFSTNQIFTEIIHNPEQAEELKRVLNDLSKQGWSKKK